MEKKRINLLFKYWRLSCLFLCFALTLGTPNSGFAQNEQDEFTLDEIIVTAEKREAELQKIPMEISVLRTDDMRRLDVNQVYDLEKILPDVSTSAMIGSFVVVSIRDVETGMWNSMFETTVATHLDGIQLTRFGGMENFFFDLERVEILKGPQGTLYGRGSTAGSINIITKKPVLGEFGGSGEFEYGSHNSKRVDLAINVPIVEKLAMRFSGRLRKADGIGDTDYGDADSRSGRLSFYWEPDDRQSFLVVGDWTMFEETGYNMSGFGADGYYYDTYGDVTIVENTTKPYDSPFTKGGPVYSPWKSRWAVGDLTDYNYNDNHMYGVMAQYQFDFDFMTATATYGHHAMHEAKVFWAGGAFLTPQPYIPYSMGGIPTGPKPYTEVTVGVIDNYLALEEYPTSDTDTVEVRFTSNTSITTGDTFEWIAGYMAQNDTVTEQMVIYNGYFVKVTTIAQGAYAQASYTPFDKWEFTGGFRWNWDSKEFLGNVGFNKDANGEIIWDWGMLDHRKYSWSEPNYKFTVSYTPTEDIMAYLQYSKGYRTGNVGFDGEATDPEFLYAYEFGLKSRWLDNRLQVNGAMYYYDYENYNRWVSVYKCTIANPDHSCQDINGDGLFDREDHEYDVPVLGISPGGAEQKGLSFNLTYLFTVDDVFTINATWRNNKYGTYNFRGAILALYPDSDNAYDYYDQSGKEFGGSPIRGNMSFSHTFRFDNMDTLTANMTLFYNGKGIDQDIDYGEPTHYVMPGRDDYWTGDFSLTYVSTKWMPDNKRWHIRASANNFWDEEALDSITYSNDSRSAYNIYPDHSGIITGRFINPRMLRISFGLDF